MNLESSSQELTQARTYPIGLSSQIISNLRRLSGAQFEQNVCGLAGAECLQSQEALRWGPAFPMTCVESQDTTCP